MKIGIFGGAFNPVHNGHIALANAYLNALKLNKIIFVPTSLPPHKTAENLIGGKDRINMLYLAVKGNDSFEISDVEFKREGKSYTYDTLCDLRKVYPDDEFFLIVGADQYLTFLKWYKAEEILNSVTVCSAARNHGEYEKLKAFKNTEEKMKNTVISDFEVFVVSSSDIREKVKRGESISDLVNEDVKKYIEDKKLYV